MRRRWARVGLCCVGLALTRCGAGSSVAPESPANEAARLARENESLRHQAELAAADRFYMILDPQASQLRIMFHGVVLREVAMVSVETGTPRVAFRRATPPSGWRDQVWSGAVMTPSKDKPRVEIQPPPPGEEIDQASFVMPPLPEEAYPTPPRFWMQYKGGLVVEYVPTGSPPVLGFTTRMKLRLLDGLAAVAAWRHGTLRLRVVINAGDFGTFYRAAPIDSAFLVAEPLGSVPAKAGAR